jgi:PIF1-like helicase
LHENPSHCGCRSYLFRRRLVPCIRYYNSKYPVFHASRTLFFYYRAWRYRQILPLKALEHWSNTSRNSSLLLTPTGIAARNIDGNTIHSGMSVCFERESYHTGLFQFTEEKMETLKKISVLIIDEVSMVDGRLLDYISSVLARLKGNNRPFGNIHVLLFGDLMQLPPVDGIKVFKASCTWRLFHPLFLEQPRRQTNQRFFRVLNKIRFGIIDTEVKDIPTERWQEYNPLQNIWSTLICPDSLRQIHGTQPTL